MPQSIATRIAVYLVVVLALMLTGAAAAASDVDTETETNLENEIPEFLVILREPQDEMYGPDALPKRFHASVAFWGSFLGIGGMAAGLVLDGIDSYRESPNKSRVSQAINSRVGAFDFEAAVLHAIY